MAVFKHKPLSSTTSCIRLFRVLPAKDDSIQRLMKVAVLVVPADNTTLSPSPAPATSDNTSASPQPGSDTVGPVAYQCLSYCWGDSDATKSVQILNQEYEHEGTMLLRPNLHDFLMVCCRRLKTTPTESETWWWVDAICIDQNNDKERAQQVRLMENVYAQASGVHVWLGDKPASYSSLTTLTSLRERYTVLMHRSKQNTGMSGEIREIYDAERRLASQEAQRLLAALEPSDTFAHYMFFRNHQYWGRVWIIQETALATELFIVTPDVDLSIATFEGCLDIWRRVSLKVWPPAEALTWKQGPFHNVLDIRQRLAKARRQQASKLSIAAFLRYATDLSPSCHDEHDQIYGVMAVAEFDRSVLRIDYGFDTWELFMQLVTGQSNISLDTPRAKDYFALMMRLRIDFLSNFDAYFAKAQAKSRVVHCYTGISDFDVEVRCSQETIETLAHPCWTDNHENAIVMVPLWDARCQVAFCTSATRKFHAAGFLYRWKQGEDSSWTEIVVPTTKAELNVVWHTTRRSPFPTVKQLEHTLKYDMTEALVLKQLYWLADPSNVTAQRLLGFEHDPDTKTSQCLSDTHVTKVTKRSRAGSLGLRGQKKRKSQRTWQG